MRTRQIYRAGAILIAAVATSVFMVFPGAWASAFGAATGCDPIASGNTTSGDPSASATVICPTPSPSSNPGAASPPPGVAPPGGGGGANPQPLTPQQIISMLPSLTTPQKAQVICPNAGNKQLQQLYLQTYGAAYQCGVNIQNGTPPPTALTMATSPPPSLAPYVAQAFEQILTNPGTIKAAPPNHTGLVNMPQCYWVTGQSVPDTKTVSMDLKGAPNGAGQQITYHIALTVQLDKDKTVWNFGDGSQQTTTVPIPCIGDSGGASGLVAHNYVTYSQDQPNGVFVVTASETYEASAVMTWNDDTGHRTLNVPINPATETVTTAPYSVRIDQEEGVGG